VLEQFSTYNLATLEPDPEAGPKHAALVAALPPVLGLTDLQLQEISAGASLFTDLLSSIMREQLQQQRELTADTSAGIIPSSSSSSKPCDSSSGSSSSGSSSSGSSSSGSSGSGSSGSSSSGSYTPLSRRDLVGQQRSTGRMQALLRKEYCMRAAAGAWLGGCLSWQQLTKAAVMCWPHPLHMVKLMLEIARYAQERSG
jgi:hypothetical protein